MWLWLEGGWITSRQSIYMMETVSKDDEWACIVFTYNTCACMYVGDKQKSKDITINHCHCNKSKVVNVSDRPSSVFLPGCVLYAKRKKLTPKIQLPARRN